MFLQYIKLLLEIHININIINKCKIKMKYRKELLNFILSFFPLIKKLQVLSISKSLQRLLSIDISNYQLFNSFSQDIRPVSNMSCYYDYYCSKFSETSQSKIKECLLVYLNQYCLHNSIEIDSLHPFSVDILNVVTRNIVLNIKNINDKIKTKDNKNITTIIIHKDFRDINTIIEKVIPINIKKIHFRYSVHNIAEIINKLRTFAQLEQITFIDKSLGKEEILLLQQFFPHIKSIELNQESEINLNSFKEIQKLIIKNRQPQLTINPTLIECINCISYHPILLAFINLHSLSILEPISPNDLIRLIDRCNYLHFVSFRLDTYQTTNESFQLVKEQLLHIREVNMFIDVYKVSKFKLKTLSMNNLTVLTLKSVPSLDIRSIFLSNINLQKIVLKSIGLVNCGKDNYEGVNFASITSIKISHSKVSHKVIDFIVNCLNLLHLKLGSINSQCVLDVVNNCNKWRELKSLSLEAKNGVNAIKFEQHNLALLRLCPFLESIKFKFRWVEKIEHLNYLLESVHKLNFVNKIHLGSLWIPFEKYKIEQYLLHGREYLFKYLDSNYFIKTEKVLIEIK